MAAQPPTKSHTFPHIPHPHIAEHAHKKPVKVDELHGSNLNGKIALLLTKSVGTMWCAYAFALLALVALPGAIQGGLLTMVMWISQTFIQLVMLSVIMVGQNILGEASDKRAEETYKDADATFYLAHRIQEHLDLQDQQLSRQDDRLEGIIAALKEAFPKAGLA